MTRSHCPETYGNLPHVTRRAYRACRPRPAPLAAGLILIAVAAAAGCGSASQPPPRPVAVVRHQQHGALFRGIIYVNGAAGRRARLVRTFTDRVTGVASCAAAAQHGDAPGGKFLVPSPAGRGPAVDIDVAGFHGPGTYSAVALRRDRSDEIALPGASGEAVYVINSRAARATSGREILYLYRDGSGELAYADAHLDGKAANPAIAGLIEWTCS